MTSYSVGQIIEASTYNSFAADINKVMMLGSGDFGYGQDPTLVATVVTSKSLPDVVAGSTIRSSQWLNWRNNISAFNVHQGTDVVAEASAVVPPATDFEITDLILAYDGSDSRWNASANLIQSTSARLVVSTASQVNTGNVLTDTRATGWNTKVQHIFTATFSDVDAARHFFNSGGQIEISGTLAGAATSKNDDWRSILSRAGTFVFGQALYYAGDAAVTDVQRAQTTGSAAAYTANDLTIFEKRDAINGTRGSEGRIITFTVDHNDDAVENVDENVTGTLSSIIDRRISTGAISASAPVFATTTSLTVGS